MIVCMREDDDRSILRDICIGIAYIIAVGINVYLIADQLTNGESSRQVSLWITKTGGKWRRAITIEETVQKEAGHVIWEAINTVEDAENAG